MRRSWFLLALAALVPPLPAQSQSQTVDVAITTKLGKIVVRLDAAHAPNTTKNFLRYVDSGAYKGATFYRAVRKDSPEYQAQISVIQGGLAPLKRDDVYQPIQMESTKKTGLHNDVGTIAMARGNDQDTATSEFFISTADNRGLDGDRFPDGYGYAVFGKVISGMDVARKILASPEIQDQLDPAIPILSITRVKS
jgi:peptidyl-prolyl cis-trans isomerase A (cyclophilin A)